MVTTTAMNAAPTPGRRAGPSIGVMIVDDHAVVRSGLANLIGLEPDMRVVAQAESGAAAIELWRRHRPDVGVIDVLMTGLDGIETLRRIRRIDPRARVVMLTSSEVAADAIRAEEAGAAAYLTKHLDHDRILDVIREVHAGHVGIRLGVRRGGAAPLAEPLSAREITVLKLMREGESNAEIGRRLGIAESTVKRHITHMLLKLGASDRTSAVARGFDLGLLAVSRDR
jgi:DNA-binding NarL/FixJ family response regulator